MLHVSYLESLETGWAVHSGHDRACAARILPSMIRRLGLASLAVAVFAFAGASAGPARPLQSLRLVVSVAWLNAPEQVEHEARPHASRIPQPSVTTASRPPRSVAFRRLPVEHSLFQRPPPLPL
jgi:hypothetical protein